MDSDAEKFSAYEELTLDSVTMRPMLYPKKLFGRFYDITTLNRLLDAEFPNCPFSRQPFRVFDIEKPNMFEQQFFEAAKTHTKVTPDEANAAKHDYILFCRKHLWNREGAELGDVECMVNLSMEIMSQNRLTEAKQWASKAARTGSLFAYDVLGHIAMLEKDFEGAHEYFVRCWAAPEWATRGRSAYFIAECYFERDMYPHALRWANRAIELGEGSEAITLCAQINYLRNKFKKCILMAEWAKRDNMLAAFIYAMCAMRQVGKFKGDRKAIQEGSELMHQLQREGHIEAGRFLTDQFMFDTVRNANRAAFRPRKRFSWIT